MQTVKIGRVTSNNVCSRLFHTAPRLLTYSSHAEDELATTMKDKIAVYCKSLLQDKAALIFNEMKKQQITPDLETYNYLLEAFAKRKRLDRVQVFWEELRSQGLSPDHTSYHALIKAVGAEEGIDAARSILQQMRDANVEPTISTYNELLFVCEANNDLDYAEEILKETARYLLKPDIITYNRFLAMSVHTQDISIIRKWLEKMKEEGLDMNNESYCHLILACGEAGLFEDALTAFSDMKNDGRVNAMTTEVYTCLIKACLKCEKPDDAMKCYEEMKGEDIVPSQETFDVLITYYGKNHILYHAKRLLEDLKEMGITPTRSIARVQQTMLYLRRA